MKWLCLWNPRNNCFENTAASTLMIGYWQTEQKRRNCDSKPICNVIRGFGTRRGVICPRGVSHGIDGAHPLWQSQSPWTQIVFADDFHFSWIFPALSSGLILLLFPAITHFLSTDCCLFHFYNLCHSLEDLSIQKYPTTFLVCAGPCPCSLPLNWLHK